ncbi:MAG: amidase family protein, partial [Patescibacteria group bacterium]
YGPTKKPWSKDHVPGGSSSGSAVAVATDMAIAATGTDTGGSIRLPASFTNTVGLKPTYGRVSRYGMVAMASSHDSIGHFSKTVEDSALFLNITAGNDDMDATTSSAIVLNYTENIGKGVKGLKIGTDPDFFSKHIENESLGLLKDAYNLIKNILKAEIVPDISLPHSSYANACYYILQPSEVSSNLARYDGIRYGNDRSYFGDEAKRRIMLGTHTLSSGYYDQYYNRALKVRSIIIDEFKKAFQRVDAIIAPISPTPPWKLGEKTDDPLKMYLSDIFTVTANLTGLPALSIPIGFTKKGLPVGMQIIGNYFSEDILFRIGHAYEQATNWNTKKPNL